MADGHKHTDCNHQPGTPNDAAGQARTAHARNRTRTRGLYQAAAARAYLLIAFLFSMAASLPYIVTTSQPWDTGLYLGLSSGVVRDGSFWTLRAGELMYFNKPPLTFWLYGLSFWVFGDQLWAMKLVTALSAATCCVLVAAIGARLAGRTAGLCAGVVLALATPTPAYPERMSTDTFMLVFLLLAAYAGIRMVDTPARRRFIVLGGLAIGAALMTRPLYGPIVVLPVGLWVLLMGNGVQRSRAILSLGAMALIGVGLAVPWHVSMAVVHGDAFTAWFFGSETVGRNEWSRTNGWATPLKTLQIHVPVLCALVIGSCYALFRDRPSRNGMVFGLLWAGFWCVVVMLFVGLRSERHNLPIYAGLALAVGAGIGPLLSNRVMPIAALASLVFFVGQIASSWVLWDPAEPKAIERFAHTVGAELGDRPLWCGALTHAEAGRIAFHTGRWPEGSTDFALTRIGGSQAVIDAGPPAGCVTLWNVNRVAPTEADGKVVFRIGQYAAIDRSAR